MSGQERVHARVEGIVQGVGFRYFTRRQAQALGLVGYVRNLPDGCVELEAEGEADRVAGLLEAVRRGPPGAHVREVRTDARPVRGSESTFEIRF